MKILCYDLETQPTLGYVWSAWQQNMLPGQIKEHGKVITWAAKWVGEKQVYFGADWEPDVNGKGFIERLHDLLMEADVILTYNGDKFDVRVLNTAILLAGLKPLPAHKSIDMFKVVKRRFALFHARMDSVASLLGLEGKTDTGGMQLWIDVMKGDKKAQKKMEKYNRQDIKVLEDIYEKLKGWIVNHPTGDDIVDGECPNCGSDSLQKRGFHRTKVSKFQRYQCNGCGSWHRSRTNLLTKHTKPDIVTL